MINGKQFADVLDYLAEQRRLIESREPNLRVMVCEHEVHAHVVCGSKLFRAKDYTPTGKLAPFTTRWVTCPIAGHRSRHFFLQVDGRTHPAPCRMHPLPANIRMKPEQGEALDAASRIGGHEALVAGLQKHVKFDPFYWRLWDLVAYHQRATVQGEYAG